ncbi:unnamed protein product [Orchesella dallaii]|uniref:RING-type E3 ubiquitin transferase n=1 Tax=Orchesella dallaii TaxID=48710 RepID=A0ABP1RM92_9HEXA
MERETIIDFTNEKEMSDTSLRSRYRLNQELPACSPKLLLSLMKCIVCEKPIDSTVYGSCKNHGHSICKPCYHGCLTFLSKSSIGCPFVFDHEQKLCKAVIIPVNFENGMQEHWDNYLNRLNFQSNLNCPSVIYGCDFIGQSEMEMLTHSFSCKFRHLRECGKFLNERAKVKKCGAVFDSISELLKHLSFKHDYMQGKQNKEIILIPFNYVPNHAIRETDGDDNKWRPLIRLPTSYENGRYCLLLVDENATSIRFWVTEVDPTRDLTKQDSCYVVKVPVLGDYSYPSCTYEFNGRILPYMTLSFNDTDTAADVPYFVMPKNFLRQYAEPNANGKAIFRIFLTLHSLVKKGQPLSSL